VLTSEGPAVTSYDGEWLTLEQAAAKLGIDRAAGQWRSTLRGVCDSEQLGYTELRPGVWRVRNDDVDELLASRRWQAREDGQ
jgi:hypothetical protein